MYNDNHLEEKYKPEFSGLAQATWSLSPTAKKRPVMPIWFDDVVSKRGFGMLSLMNQASHPWLVFPEFVPGFSLVAFHKTKKNKKPVKLKDLQLRYFQGFEALDADMLVQKAVGITCKKWVSKNKGIMKLADDNLLMFMFPSDLLKKVLLALGMPREEMYKYNWIKKEQINWSASGF